MANFLAKMEMHYFCLYPIVFPYLFINKRRLERDGFNYFSSCLLPSISANFVTNQIIYSHLNFKTNYANQLRIF